MKTIVTVLAGRRHCMAILNEYLRKALDCQLIDEVHWWNYARVPEDELFLRENSNLRHTSASLHAEYTPVHTDVQDGAFAFSFQCPHDMHVKLTGEGSVAYEIVLGGWDNTRSVIRRLEDGCDDEEVASSDVEGVANATAPTYIQVAIVSGPQMQVFSSPSPGDAERHLLLTCDIDPGFTMHRLAMKTGFRSAGDVSFPVVKNPGVFFMDTTGKLQWKDYYRYYDDARFQDTVIIKCDDDLVFMDLQQLSAFIQYARSTEHTLVFANTVNNGVSAWYQQDRYQLIPLALGHFEYPDNGVFGSLWESGHKAERLHRYFLHNCDLFLEQTPHDVVPISTHYSINCFAAHGKHWHRMADAGDAEQGDDETALTETFVKERGFSNVLYAPFYVSHLSFGRQNDEFAHKDEVLAQYRRLFDLMYRERVFTSLTVCHDDAGPTDAPHVPVPVPVPEPEPEEEATSDTVTVVFFDTKTPHPQPWNGRLMRDTCGGDGTTTLLVTWAEHWARHGHTVVLMANNVTEETCRGVQYRSLSKGSEPLVADVVVVAFPDDMEEARVLVKARTKERFVYLQSRSGTFAYDEDTVRVLRPDDGTMFPYMFDGDVVPCPHGRKMPSCVFFGRPACGFSICERATQSLPECTLYCNTYDDATRFNFTQSDRVILVSDAASSKHEVFGLLAKSKYAVYPWVCDAGWGYNVAEALAHGVIVLVPRCPLYEMLFGDAVCYVEEDGAADAAEPYVHALCDLENNAEWARGFVHRAQQWCNRKGVPRLDDDLIHWVKG